MGAPDRPTFVRTALALLLLATMVGTGAELFLVDHTEDVWQVVPLVLLGAGCPTVVAAWRWPNVVLVRAVQGLMGLMIAAGGIGLWLHYRANAEFELEMYPTLGGWALFWKAIHGASPPSLAPGAMFVVGAIGLIWSTTGDA